MTEADTGSNAQTTVDFDSAADFDSGTNLSPAVVVIAILLIYFIVFFFLRSSEKSKRREGVSTDIGTIHAFAASAEAGLDLKG